MALGTTSCESCKDVEKHVFFNEQIRSSNENFPVGTQISHVLRGR